MTVKKTKLTRSARQLDVPPAIKGILYLERGLTIPASLLKTWWPGTELNRRRQPFQGLCCSSNNLGDFRWPPKYLRSRERHANRGWKSWVQKQVQEGPKTDTRCIFSRRSNWASAATMMVERLIATGVLRSKVNAIPMTAIKLYLWEVEQPSFSRSFLNNQLFFQLIFRAPWESNQNRLNFHPRANNTKFWS